MPSVAEFVPLTCRPTPGPVVAEYVPPGYVPKQQAQPQQQPPQLCSMFAGTVLHRGLPLPGSVEFCQIADEIGRAFVTIANGATAWLEQTNPIDDIASMVGIALPPGGTLTPVGLVIGLWNEVIKGAQRAANHAREILINVLKELIAIHKCIYQRCNGLVSYGVWLLRQLVKILESVRVGWDIGLWLTVDLHIEFDAVMEWLDLLQKYYCPIEIPAAEEATHAWLLDRITIEQRNCIWLLHGLSPETYEPFALTSRDQLEWKEAIQFVRRMKWPDEAENVALRQRGFVTPLDQQMAREMFWELPTIPDHLHWLQRNVDDSEYVQRFGLLDGFSTQEFIRTLPGFADYTTVSDTHGRDFWKTFGPDLAAQGMRPVYAAYHYAAHWIMPSPEQMKEFIYRSDEIQQITGQPFTLDDFDRILAEQDYNPLARGWFKATAYNVPAISYIKEWYRQGIIDKEQLQRYHRFLGFNPVDAENFVGIDDLQKRRMRASASRGWTTRAATEAWFTGQIHVDEQEDVYRRLGYSTDEAAEAREVATRTFSAGIARRAMGNALGKVTTTLASSIDVGVMSGDDAAKMLVDAGWPRQSAEAFASLQSATAGTRRVRAAITYLRRMVLQGIVTFDDTRQELSKMGVIAASVDAYVNLWKLQLTPGRKRRSATEIVNDVASGHIDRDEAVVRLTNLGYNDADTRLYLADAQGKMTKMEAARKQAEEKAGLARDKAQTQLLMEANRYRDDVLKQAKIDAPVAKLQKWAEYGIIGKDWFYQRMRLYGYPEEHIARYYAESCAKATATCVDTNPQPKGVDEEGDGVGDNA
jgi:hypothetical protein